MDRIGAIYYRVFFRLAGNQDRNKILDKVDFGLDQINHFGVMWP